MVFQWRRRTFRGTFSTILNIKEKHYKYFFQYGKSRQNTKTSKKCIIRLEPKFYDFLLYI